MKISILVLGFMLICSISANADLLGRYYRGTNIKDGIITTDGLSIALTRIDSNIDFWDGSRYYRMNPGGLSDNYTVEWTGYIKIDIAGEYGFGTISDDGSQVWIDGRMIMDNGEGQWYDWEDNITEFDEGEPNVPVYLSAGYHSIKVRFYEGPSYDGIELWWLLPGSGVSDRPYYGTNFHGTAPTANPATNWEIIPATVLITPDQFGQLVCEADANGDMTFNLYEFSMLASDWLKTEPELPSDYNLDGKVDMEDISWMLSFWLCDCPESQE